MGSEPDGLRIINQLCTQSLVQINIMLTYSNEVRLAKKRNKKYSGDNNTIDIIDLTA